MQDSDDFKLEKSADQAVGVDHRIPELVIGDAGRIRQTLLNLVGNGIKFTEAGGVTVEVSVESEDAEYISIRFSVIDTGIGIREEDQHLLFKPFTQVDGSDTRKYSGTGLGLSISKHFVEMMGGKIGVESGEGRGTIFWFIVAFKKCVQQAQLADPSAQTHPALAQIFDRELILLVEDSAILQKLVVKQLGNAGIQVYVTSNGLAAVEAVKELDFDLILMDCQLPGMDGFAATKAIRQIEVKQGRHTPIIALTAQTMEGDREKCLEAGMDDYLCKPTSIVELLEKVKLWIDLKKCHTAKKLQ